MQKENIIINSIAKNFTIRPFVEEMPKKELTSITIDFDYRTIRDAVLRIETDTPLTEEEIKDKIIEVLQ